MRRSTAALFVIATVFVLVALLLRTNGAGTTTPASTTSVVDMTSTTSMISTPSPTSSSTTTTIPDGTEVCDLYSTITETGTVESPDLVEGSGLAVSRTTPNVLWAHNDSRGTASLFAFTYDGQDLGPHDVPGAFAFDWEDISAGPGPSGEGAFLYVGDIGDNFDIRGGLITVYRVPDVNPSDLDGAFPESIALTYQYPQDSHNAEALFIDPVEPALYVITKDAAAALVFKASLEPSEGPVDMELVGTLFLDAEVSGADMSSDGSTLVVRGYRSVWMWYRQPGVSITDMLAEEPCLAPSPDERQGEAIALDEELSYLTTSEGSHPPIHVVRRIP